MLPPFIIEQIRQREELEKGHHEQPRLELPLPPNMPSAAPPDSEDEPNRGVIVLDI